MVTDLVKADGLRVQNLLTPDVLVRLSPYMEHYSMSKCKR